jgi:hypothetical protein
MTDAARPRPGKKDIGTLIIAGLFVATGLITLNDVTGYSDTDSIVFPSLSPMR